MVPILSINVLLRLNCPGVSAPLEVDLEAACVDTSTFV